MRKQDDALIYIFDFSCQLTQNDGDGDGAYQVDGNEGHVVQDRVPRDQKRIIGREQVLEILEPDPWAFVDSLPGIVLLEGNHKTRQRHVIVDKQINETRQHQNIDRQKTYKCFSSFLALLTFHSCHVFPSPFFSYPQPVPKRSGFDRFFSSYNLRRPVFGTAQSFFDLNS